MFFAHSFLNRLPQSILADIRQKFFVLQMIYHPQMGGKI